MFLDKQYICETFCTLRRVIHELLVEGNIVTMSTTTTITAPAATAPVRTQLSTTDSTSSTPASTSSTKPQQSSNSKEKKDEEELDIYDEIEIEDMTFDSTLQIYHYPCPCGDRFEIAVDSLRDGEDIAVCPSCSLMIRVIFDVDDLPEKKETERDGVKEEEEEQG